MENIFRLSGANLRAASLVLGLSLSLAAPCAVFAAGGNSTAMQTPQKHQVKGQVVDENGEPLIGVTVQVKGATGGAITDFDGNYVIDVAPNAELTFSYVGYLPQTVKASQAALIQMQPDAVGLEDVVVIGYGVQKKRDLTGAISTVKADDITLAPVSNPMESLQGKVAGLDITRSSGAAGAGISMQLRGTRSIDASGNPVVIIDGMPGDISTINSNDIESIEVLKDASSTAVYGAEGANGVIIVTTKSGKEGKAKVSFNAYLGVNGWSTVPKMYNGADFFALKKQAQTNGNQYLDDTEVMRNVYQMYAAEQWKQLGNSGQYADFGAFLDGSKESLLPGFQNYLNANTIDWADEMLNTGVTQNYSVSVSGGTEKTKAYLSLNFNDENGQYSNDNYKVYSTNLRLDQQVSKWLTVGVNMQGSFAHKNSADVDLENALVASPVGKLYDEDGNVRPFIVDGEYTASLLLNSKSNYRNNSQNTRLYLNPYIRVTPFKGFTWESRLNASLAYSKSNSFIGIGSYRYYNDDLNKETIDGVSTTKNVKASVGSTNSYNYKWENIFTYSFEIAKDHSFTLTGVTSWNHNRTESVTASADNITSNAYLWHNLGKGQNQTANSYYTMSRGMGFVGRVNYSYLGKYLASVSARHDGSSRLAEGNRWDTFPAFSLGWRLSDEKFMESTRSWLDNLKVRFGWGVSGTANISPYQTFVNLIQNYNILGNQTLLSYGYPQEGVVDPTLGWEKSYNTNIGIDASFLNGRIDVSMDYYYTKTKDIIYQSLVPVTNGGYTSGTQYTTTTNIASSQNKGFEATITGRPFIARKEGDFSWTANLTFSRNSEKLTDFTVDGKNQDIKGDVILRAGEPIKAFYGYKLLGTWKTSEAQEAAIFGQVPGDLKIACPDYVRHLDADGKVYYTGLDADGNEVVYDGSDADHKISATTQKQVLGQRNPKWTMGFKNTFNYKNFDLSIYMYWRFGQMINYSMLGRFRPDLSGNFPTYFDFWTEETGEQNHYFPRLDSTLPFTAVDGFAGLNYVDGSFFKVKNITVGYTLPKKALKTVGMESLRVYGTITNPWLIAKSDLLKDYDPEMGGSIKFPLTKQLVFGVNITF